MNEFFAGSAYAGVVLSLGAYALGLAVKKKLKKAVFNPLLVAIVVTMAVLVVGRVDYQTYNSGAKLLTWFLTPATVCLAIPLYEQLDLLRKHWKAILAGICAGVLTSLVTVLVLCAAFRLGHEMYVTLLPKSITTAIGMGVSEELGGNVTVTVAAIIITGVSGNIIGETVLRVARITEPVAKGIAMGTSAHAIGTAKAVEMGEAEGAMSSLSIAVAGMLTVIGASVFASFL